MGNVGLLRVLIAADVLLAWSVIGIEALFHKTLPPTLRDYVVGKLFTPTDSTIWNAALFGLWFTSLFGFCVAWIGLLLSWRPARPIYVASWGLAVLVMAASGPSVLSAPGAVVDTLGTLVSGAVIGLVYLSDLKHRFEATPNRTLVTITP